MKSLTQKLVISAAALAVGASWLIHQSSALQEPPQVAAPQEQTQQDQITVVNLQPARVTRVVDGDTIKTDTGETIRIIGLNTPETRKPGSPVECYGKQASAEATRLLNGKDVYLVNDTTQDEKDKYGRRLSHVIINDESYAEIMIRNGYGLEYTYRNKYPAQQRYIAAERNARAQKLGGWGACTTTPWNQEKP